MVQEGLTEASTTWGAVVEFALTNIASAYASSSRSVSPSRSRFLIADSLGFLPPNLSRLSSTAASMAAMEKSRTDALA